VKKLFEISRKKLAEQAIQQGRKESKKALMFFFSPPGFPKEYSILDMFGTVLHGGGELGGEISAESCT